MFENIFANKLIYDPTLRDTVSLKILSFEIMKEFNDQDFSDPESPPHFWTVIFNFFFNTIILLAIEMLSTTMFYN